jgi:hypothetical protein
VAEDVAGVQAGLDPLQSGVIVLVVQRVPGDPGGIPLRVGEVDIRMIDKAPSQTPPCADSIGRIDGESPSITENSPLFSYVEVIAKWDHLWESPSLRSQFVTSRLWSGRLESGTRIEHRFGIDDERGPQRNPLTYYVNGV